MGAGSSAWLERSTDNRKVAGSNPARPIIRLLKEAVVLVYITSFLYPPKVRS